LVFCPVRELDFNGGRIGGGQLGPGVSAPGACYSNETLFYEGPIYTATQGEIAILQRF
jgi:hypothetical protein